jgi:hypothetical protein
VLGTHTWVAPATLERLGPDDPEWRRGLAGMLVYAAEHGWTDERGQVRVHLEEGR